VIWYDAAQQSAEQITRIKRLGPRRY